MLLLCACSPRRGPGAIADSPEGPSSAAAGAPRAKLPTAIPWPELPQDGRALDALVEAETLRPIAVFAPLTVDTVLASLREAARGSSLAGGWRPIAAALSGLVRTHRAAGANVFLLFGSFHDAAGQLDAFRQLVGPLGITPAPLLALEQLQADGAWAAVDGSQAGDDGLLRRYLDSGDDAVLADLERTQRERDYTAWKYDYVEKVTDLVSGARGAGRTLVGCDMPSNLQAQLRTRLGEQAEVLRDLHCALALRRATKAAPVPVAIFIGDAHLSPERLPRFLPAEAEVLRIHLLGTRAHGGDLEQGLAQRLAIIEPLLVPLGDARFVLLLPDARLSAKVERVRSSEPVAANDRHVIVVEGFAGSARVGAEHATRDGNTRLLAAPGRVPFLLEQAERAIAGTVDMPMGGSVTLAREPDGTLRIHIRTPAK